MDTDIQRPTQTDTAGDTMTHTIYAYYFTYPVHHYCYQHWPIHWHGNGILHYLIDYQTDVEVMMRQVEQGPLLQDVHMNVIAVET